MNYLIVIKVFILRHFLHVSGLMAGLVATVITKWKANDKYSYGYVRAETLAGFINGLFLLFISFFIFSEVKRNSEAVKPVLRKTAAFNYSDLGINKCA